MMAAGSELEAALGDARVLGAAHGHGGGDRDSCQGRLIPGAPGRRGPAAPAASDSESSPGHRDGPDSQA